MDISWAQQERFKLIERCLLWARQLNAKVIMDTFHVSRYQAGRDIKAYNECCPRNLLPYKASDRCYRPTTDFSPKFIVADPVEVVRSGVLVNEADKLVHIVPTVIRHIKEGVVPVTLAAIEHGRGMQVLYASSTTPIGRKRTLYPSVMVYAGNRLHIRAFCPERNEFRDFVLSRFLNVPRLVSSKHPLPEDLEWSETVSITLVPNPALSEEGRKLITNEYRLAEFGAHNVRRALVHYFLQFNSLPTSEAQLEEARLNPWAFPVLPQNSASLLALLFGSNSKR